MSDQFTDAAILAEDNDFLRERRRNLEHDLVNARNCLLVTRVISGLAIFITVSVASNMIAETRKLNVFTETKVVEKFIEKQCADPCEEGVQTGCRMRAVLNKNAIKCYGNPTTCIVEAKF